MPRAIAPRAAAAVAAASAAGVASPVSAPVIKVRAADFPGASEFPRAAGVKKKEEKKTTKRKRGRRDERRGTARDDGKAYQRQRDRENRLVMR